LRLTPLRAPLLLVLCLWHLLLSPSPSDPLAADSPVDKPGREPDVRFLYPVGQVYKQTKVFPLILQLSNPNPAPRTFKARWNSNLTLPEPLSSVTLQPGEKRRFTLYFPRNEISGIGTVEVNGLDYSTDLQPCTRTNITAVLSPPGEKFDYLRTLKLEVDPTQPAVDDKGQPVKPSLVPLVAISRLDPELLPETWSMLSCLDVIVLYDSKSMALSKLQQTALLSWVCQGGRLVLVSDGLPEEFRDTPFEPHLPMRPGGVVSAPGGLVQLIGQPTEGAETLVSYHGRPLLMRKPLMQGQVFLLTAPLTNPGPLSVEQAEEVWVKVQPELPSDPTGGYSYSYRGGNYYQSLTANTLQNIPELPRAGPGWVALFLLVYALIVGPVNLGLLRRKDKMLWSFVTVPVIAILFAGGAYLANRLNRSSVPVLRELGLLQVKPGDPRGYARSEALFYSPSGGRYQLRCSPQAICHPATYNYRDAPFGMYDALPDGGLQANITTGTWDLFALGMEALIDLPAPLQASYRKETLWVNSPFASGPDEAQLYNPTLGASGTFTLSQGEQTLPLPLADPGHYSNFDKLGSPADPIAHPGRAQLLQNLTAQGADVFLPERTYLLFWTDTLVSPVQPEGPSVRKGEFLVILELSS
jgi:hypothetical protein